MTLPTAPNLLPDSYDHLWQATEKIGISVEWDGWAYRRAGETVELISRREVAAVVSHEKIILHSMVWDCYKPPYELRATARSVGKSLTNGFLTEVSFYGLKTIVRAGESVVFTNADGLRPLHPLVEKAVNPARRKTALAEVRKKLKTAFVTAKLLGAPTQYLKHITDSHILGNLDDPGSIASSVFCWVGTSQGGRLKDPVNAIENFINRNRTEIYEKFGAFDVV